MKSTMQLFTQEFCSVHKVHKNFPCLYITPSLISVLLVAKILVDINLCSVMRLSLT